MTLVHTYTAQESGMTENFHLVFTAFLFTILMRKEWSCVSSFLLLYANTAGICPENCLSSLLQSWSYSLRSNKRTQWETNSLCRFKYGLWQYSLLCGVSVFFNGEAIKHKLTLNIPLRPHYFNMNTNFKPLVFIAGFFFPCTSAMSKINLGANFLFRKTSCAELW